MCWLNVGASKECKKFLLSVLFIIVSSCFLRLKSLQDLTPTYLSGLILYFTFLLPAPSSYTSSCILVLSYIHLLHVCFQLDYLSSPVQPPPPQAFMYHLKCPLLKIKSTPIASTSVKMNIFLWVLRILKVGFHNSIHDVWNSL